MVIRANWTIIWKSCNMSSLSLKPSENHDSIMFLKSQICEMFTFWFNAKVFLSKYHYLLLLFCYKRIFWTLFPSSVFLLMVAVINYSSINFLSLLSDNSAWTILVNPVNGQLVHNEQVLLMITWTRQHSAGTRCFRTPIA